MAEATNPKFRCSFCKQEWDTYASVMMHCRLKAECKEAGAVPEAVSAVPKFRANMTPEEHDRWLKEQAAYIIQSQSQPNGHKPPARTVEPESEEEEETIAPGWPVQSMAQQAASEPLPDWIDEEGIELPPLPEGYTPPAREVSPIPLIARGQAIVLDAIEIAAYEAWCREGWQGSLKEWVSNCINGYFAFMGIELHAFAIPQPQREYLLAKAGLKDASS